MPACSRTLTPTIKPVDTFNTDDIRQIRQKTGLSQVIFAGSLGVSPKTVEAWRTAETNPKEPPSDYLKSFGMILGF